MNGDLLQQVYGKYSREILVYLYSLSRDRQLAEDLTQETFVKALLSLPDGHANIRAWLYKVARNLFINHFRSRASTVDIDAIGELPGSEGEAETILINKLRSRKLYEAILRLDRQKREVIILQYFSGFPLAQAAEMLNLSPANVRVLSHRAKKELKTMLEEMNDEVF